MILIVQEAGRLGGIGFSEGRLDKWKLTPGLGSNWQPGEECGFKGGELGFGRREG